MKSTVYNLSAKLVMTFSFFFLIYQGFAFQELSGEYSIGSGGDFPTLNDGILALETEGVSGPVTFKIKTGTYVGQSVIPEISGASAAARLR
ncbi:hypothetical protein, partial [Pleomorphovibrio marinus]|uniref:hypothetical protein n=1 Tax=Pleomorphovibrio marinus TaxID=2164132 RepID=UPI0013008084